ncbi:MAG TPA: DNA mismatch repair endonuclease MutL [Desulfuromonadales bacterium]|nr:DNA mismatch repair endonuclease MutL [Desulfuromonadales bacterium]
MSSKIKILPEKLANQIAAGEVVERPASVVKELVENAIDAGAGEIFVEIENGGKRTICVTDNGCGMNRDDAFLCLERHATSKIGTEQDLFALHSMGFRGEALPAIASVSRFRLQTRSLSEETGWQIYAEGGIVRQAEAVGGTAGTVVEVRSLFFNTPARRKFLKRDETEFGHIADVVSRQAMARPDIHFKLSHGGRVHLEAFRHQRLEERVAALLSRSMASEMLAFEAESGEGEMVTGLLGRPVLTRSSANYIYTYVNGRYVRDRVIQHAVLDAYRTLLERRRYPVVVLFLDLPPERVDVNVHPTKHEVRFREQGRVHDFLAKAIRDCLRGHLTGMEKPNRAHRWDDREGGAAETVARSHQPPAAEGPATGQYFQESLSAYSSVTENNRSSSAKGEIASWRPDQLAPSGARSDVPEGWRLIGQYLGSYLICQRNQDLVVIDQHAAHERIGFERLKAQLSEQGIEQQDLLMPIMIDMDHRELAAINENLEHLTRLGFDIELFGGRTVAVKSVPQLLAGTDVERLVRDVTAELNETGRANLLQDAFDQVLSVMACHSMVRANQSLSRSEMESLLREMSRIDFGSHCPHGRPVFWQVPKKDVERMFRR